MEDDKNYIKEKQEEAEKGSKKGRGKKGQT